MYLRYLSPKALSISFFLFYVAPVLLVHLALWISVALRGAESSSSSSAALAVFVAFVLWLWLVAPFGAGYVAGRIAPALPLFHALLVSTAGFLLQGVFVHFSSSTSLSPRTVLLVYLLWGAGSISASLFGAQLWRWQKARGVV